MMARVLFLVFLLFSPVSFASSLYSWDDGAGSVFSSSSGDCATAAVSYAYINQAYFGQAFGAVGCTGVASSPGEFVYVTVTNLTSSAVYGPWKLTLTAVHVDESDAADPAVFGAWFAFVFVSTVSLYFVAFGIGAVLRAVGRA